MRRICIKSLLLEPFFKLQFEPNCYHSQLALPNALFFFLFSFSSLPERGRGKGGRKRKSEKGGGGRFYFFTYRIEL
jgi:hypothetical protein